MTAGDAAWPFDPPSRRRHRQWRALTIGGVSAVAGLKPAGDGVGEPLVAPIVLNGVGPAEVLLPPRRGTRCVRVELTATAVPELPHPGGGSDPAVDDGTPMVQRDALPLTDTFDEQMRRPPGWILRPVCPWTCRQARTGGLYAVITDRLNPAPAPAGDGRTLEIPGNYP